MMAVLNLVADMLLLAATWLVPTHFNSEAISTWLVVLTLTNILLILGINISNQVHYSPH
jgi:hypothetical protein